MPCILGRRRGAPRGATGDGRRLVARGHGQSHRGDLRRTRRTDAVVEPAHAELFTQALQAKVDAANAKLALAFGEAMRAADALAARIAADDEEALMLITTGLV